MRNQPNPDTLLLLLQSYWHDCAKQIEYTVVMVRVAHTPLESVENASPNEPAFDITKYMPRT